MRRVIVGPKRHASQPITPMMPTALIALARGPDEELMRSTTASMYLVYHWLGMGRARIPVSSGNALPSGLTLRAGAERRGSPAGRGEASSAAHGARQP